MAYAMFSAGLAAKKLHDPLKFLNPEYVSTMMDTDRELRTIFEELIEKRDLIDGKLCRRTRLHDRANVPFNSELSVFYRYFISKCYFNQRNMDARSGLLMNYVTVFPFMVDSSPQIDSVPILHLFEEEFLFEIRQFIDYHVIDSDFNDLEYILIKDIERFRRKYFGWRFPMDYKRLRAIAEIGGDETEPSEELVRPLREYLSNAHRLNEAGVSWHMNLQAACNEVNAAYDRRLIPVKSAAYFRYLPEISCCELLLLLEHRFYVEDRERYAYLYKKYLLFYGYAANYAESVHPVFFVDDALFACLASMRRYMFSRIDALELEYELWMMALVHLRVYTPTEPRGPVRRTVDRHNLQFVANYVAEKLGHALDFYEATLFYPMRHRNFYASRDTVYRLMFVDVRQLELRHFYELVLKAALLEGPISRCVIYNAYTGDEMTIAMPRAADHIRNLIVTMHMAGTLSIRKSDFSLPLRVLVELCGQCRFEWPISNATPAMELFLIRGKEECFSGPLVNALKQIDFEVAVAERILMADTAAEFAGQTHAGDNADRVPPKCETARLSPALAARLKSKSLSLDRIFSPSPRISRRYGSRHSV